MQDIKELSIQARDLFAEQKFNEALSLYHIILSKSLNDSMSHYNIAMTYTMLGEYELAVAYYKKSIRLDGKNIRSVNNLAAIYINYVKDLDIAKQYLDYAIKIAPNDAEAYNHYGRISFVNKDFDLAEKYYKKSIFLDSDYYRNYYDISKVYIELNKNQEAAEALKKSIELNPEFKEAAELLSRINNG